MVVSLIINIAIIGTFSKFSDKPTMELDAASVTLEHTLGFVGALIWGIGLFSSGQSATVAGALTG
jgi:Mn2+/Fe2+ NRAMP family transporter